MRFEYYCMTQRDPHLKNHEDLALAESWFKFCCGKGKAAALTSERSGNGQLAYHVWVVGRQAGTELPNCISIHGEPTRTIVRTCNGFEHHIKALDGGEE